MPTDVTDEPTPILAPTARPVDDADRRGFPAWVVVAVVATGVALRLIVLLSPLGRPDSDEVIAALMVRNLPDDGYPPFFWGQQYGGTLELAPLWLSLKVFGWSVGALRVPTLVLGAVNTVLVWRIGRRWLTERQAQLAALVLWLGPPAALWFGVREQLFYAPTTTLGLVLGIFAYRFRERGRWYDAAVAGLALGLGVWTSSTIAYFAVPAVVVALGGHRPLRSRMRELLVAVPVAAVAFVVGAYPFIEAFVRTDGAPLDIAAKFPVTGTYWSRLGYFLVEGLPGALGFRSIFLHTWMGGAVGVVAYLGVLGLIGWSLWRSWPFPPRRAVVGWAAVGLVAYPFVYARIPFVMDDPNLRYTSYAVPFLALVLARVVDTRRAAAVVLAATLVVTGVGLARLHTISELEDHPHRVGNVGDLVPVIEVLRREGIDAVYGDYWVAYRLAFETEEGVIAATSSGIPRYDPYVEHVRASGRPAWVVDHGDQLDQLERALDGLEVGYQVFDAGELAVVVPDRHVGPMEVPEEARRPVR